MSVYAYGFVCGRGRKFVVYVMCVHELCVLFVLC